MNGTSFYVPALFTTSSQKFTVQIQQGTQMVVLLRNLGLDPNVTDIQYIHPVNSKRYHISTENEFRNLLRLCRKFISIQGWRIQLFSVPKVGRTVINGARSNQMGVQRVPMMMGNPQQNNTQNNFQRSNTIQNQNIYPQGFNNYNQNNTYSQQQQFGNNQQFNNFSTFQQQQLQKPNNSNFTNNSGNYGNKQMNAPLINPNNFSSVQSTPSFTGNQNIQPSFNNNNPQTNMSSTPFIRNPQPRVVKKSPPVQKNNTTNSILSNLLGAFVGLDSTNANYVNNSINTNLNNSLLGLGSNGQSLGNLGEMMKDGMSLLAEQSDPKVMSLEFEAKKMILNTNSIPDQPGIPEPYDWIGKNIGKTYALYLMRCMSNVDYIGPESMQAGSEYMKYIKTVGLYNFYVFRNKCMAGSKKWRDCVSLIMKIQENQHKKSLEQVKSNNRSSSSSRNINQEIVNNTGRMLHNRRMGW